jgi:hypothetical protein
MPIQPNPDRNCRHGIGNAKKRLFVKRHAQILAGSKINEPNGLQMSSGV